MSGGENFLSRWSRLKQEEPEEPVADLGPDIVAEEASADAAPVASPAEEPEAVAAADDATGASPERHPTEDIDIESLTADSDFTVFLKKGVPDFVQRRALRKLWTTDPVLANLDGMNDYENIIEEFGISDLATSDWQVGRGFMTDEDFARINERGGYVPPEEREAEDEEEDGVDEEETLVAEAEAEDEGADADTDQIGDDSEADADEEPRSARDVAEARRRDSAGPGEDDEFDVGDGDGIA